MEPRYFTSAEDFTNTAKQGPLFGTVTFFLGKDANTADAAEFENAMQWVLNYASRSGMMTADCVTRPDAASADFQPLTISLPRAKVEDEELAKAIAESCRDSLIEVVGKLTAEKPFQSINQNGVLVLGVH